jgi:Tfp pilus assembly protein PilN
MRAVNLIPPDQRRGGARGTRPVGAYLVLAGLAGLVVVVSLFAISGRRASDREAQLARVTQDAKDAEARAAALSPYARFAQLSESRVATVRSLAASRFDWAHAMREVGRVIPADVWLTTLTGTVAPGVSLEGGSSADTGSLRSAGSGPALEMTGCTTSQTAVARMMARLRLIDGVTRVSLAKSEKADVAGSGAGSAGSAGTGEDCRRGNPRFPQFQIVGPCPQRPGAPAPAARAPVSGGAR